MLLLGVILGVFFWFLDSYIDATFFYGDDFITQMMSPGMFEISIRLLVFCLFAGFGYYVQGIINQGKRIEKALYQSEQHYKKIVEIVPNIIAVQEEGNIVFSNPSGASLLGLDSPAEVIGMPMMEVVHPDYRDIAHQRMRQTMEEGTPRLWTEEKLIRADGTVINAEVIYAPFTDEQKPAVLAVIRDVTRNKLAKVALRESEEKYRTIFENTGTATAIIDEDMTLLLVSAEFEKISGCSRTEIEGKKKWTEFDIQADMEMMKEYHQMRRLNPDAVPGSYEFRSTDINNLTRYFYLNIAMIPGTKKSIASISDITERKRVVEALRQSEERFRLLAENARDLIYRLQVAPALKFEYISPVLKTLGYAPEELYADPNRMYKIVHPEDRPLLEAATQSAELLSDPLLLRWVFKQGQVIWAEMSNVPIFDADGNLVAIEGIARDVTERKKAELALMHRLKVEQAVSQAASMLVGNEETDIEELLPIVGQAVHADRVYLFIFKDLRQKMDNVCEWCSPDTTSQAAKYQNEDTGNYGWWMQKLVRNENIVISDVSQLPEEAMHERNFFMERGARSLLAVPMVYNDELLGFAGFDDTHSPHEWSVEDVRLLRAISEIIAAYWERKQSAEKIKYLGLHDSLTGLYNRTYFEEELRRLDTQDQLPVSLIMGDVNGLKLINDTFGHQEGDKLLLHIARIILAECREEYIIARVGGDEFAVILPHTVHQTAADVCERIRRSCECITGEPVRPSIALGVAAKESFSQDIRQIYKEAEDRMYRNKLLESKNTRRSIIASLQKTLSERTNETEEHTLRIKKLAVEMGRVLGLPDNQLDELALVAVLHDIGKIAVPDRILTKPGPLSPDEWEPMKNHPEIGYRIAQTSYELAHIADAILSHHERWDGQGYPQGLKEMEIPLIARIVAIVDAYDVIQHERPYRRAISQQEALHEIIKCAGSQFDPKLVETFVQLVEEHHEQPVSSGP